MNTPTLIAAIATRATRRAAVAARRGRENKGYNAAFGTLAQRAMGIEYPGQVTPTHRATIATALRGMGFAVRVNTTRDAKGRETFASLTVTA